MQQAIFEPSVTNEQNTLETALSREAQAKQWLAENREAIEAYKEKQAKQGTTFAQWAGQI